MRLDIAEESKRIAKPLHEQLGQTVHLMWIFVDAWADHNWGVWDTALLTEDERLKGFTPTRTRRLLHDLGFTSTGEIFEAAGLTIKQREVMEARYPEGGGMLLPREIARQLGWPSLRVRVHLHEGYDRLHAWVRLVDLPEAS